MMQKYANHLLISSCKSSKPSNSYDFTNRIPRTGFSPDFERYPNANAARSADNAQQIIGWKIFFTPDGNLKEKSL